ncbi:MAG: biotin/lipoyl-containing protein, partial [Nitrososphaerales archaeon]
GGSRLLKRRFKITIGGKTYEVEVEETTPAEPKAVPPPYIGPPKIPTEPPKRIVTPRPLTPPPRKTEAPRPAAPTPQPQQTQMQPPEAAAAAVPGETIKAPLPGVVVSIKVKEGDQVKQGDTLLVLESMKMENSLAAPRSGVVKRILVQHRASVQHGDPLIVLE